MAQLRRMVAHGREGRYLSRIRAERHEWVLAVAMDQHEGGGHRTEEHDRDPIEGVDIDPRVRRRSRDLSG